MALHQGGTIVSQLPLRGRFAEALRGFEIISSTVLTMLVLPALYTFFHRDENEP
ncbi:MAG: hypothetical protein ACREQY_22120 [Candidatus Binatia bacterium]